MPPGQSSQFVTLNLQSPDNKGLMTGLMEKGLDPEVGGPIPSCPSNTLTGPESFPKAHFATDQLGLQSNPES